MTNEEIEKRFQFDLSMGVFKLIDNLPIIPFDGYSKYELKLLSIILKKLGFKEDNNSTSFYVCDGISVHMEDKRFWYYGDNFDKRTGNGIPSYLIKYKF